ncbi:cache domain-containing sensor histidine kinase [Aquibacillus rhizosphaerae]|uniref:Histidine kinase n=1 Tax=Aquibacillus rhizosphaerae TaxID=3051431 RepID=A0ABT7LBC3_9BACI|nr:histidine kinase [Aquibacillus sp. LR5S19]MDL4843166.1 histidine kinase [Aquibacillus sp. LR5S19]
MWFKPRVFKSMSFRYKVMFSSVICIAVPVIICLSIYNYLTKDAVKEQAILNANKELELTEEYVSKLLEDMLYIVNFVQVDTKLNAILKQKAEQAESSLANQDYDQFVDDRNVMKTIEDITLVGEKSQVTILLKNGKYYTNYPVTDYNPLNIFDEKWFKQLDTLHGYESVWIDSQPTVFESEKTRNPYQLSVARPLRNEKSIIYGYVVVTMFENKISQIFESRAGNEEIMLINADGKVLSHRDTAQIGQRYPQGEKDEKQSDIIYRKDQDYLVSNKSVSFNNWRLISFVPYREAVSNINSIFNKVFLLLFFSFAIFFIILTYLITRITKPLVHLGNVIVDVQGGDLRVRSSIDNDDEIGRFSKSFDHMLDRINEMIEEVKETQGRKRKAELAMLQAQINPHFLFNVLNSIRMKVYKNGDKESAKMISSLSKLLRMTIDTDKGTISFYEEVNMVTDYVLLMNMRQKNKVTFVTSISNEAYEQFIPRFILQPIIENSIIHGLNQSGGTIKLHSLTTTDKFIIEIEDNGEGMDPKTLRSLQVNVDSTNGSTKKLKSSKSGFSSIGLYNVYERLVMTFGQEFNMKVDSAKGKGTRVTLLIPRGN